MSAMPKFYCTTPAYYPNDIPHIGHAYTTVVGDVLARWYRLRLGEENVLFITGLDEHGSKIEKASREKGIPPQQFVDEMATVFENAWKHLNISYNGFIRTSDERHIKTVNEIFDKVNKAGDIYKGTYKGWYCIPCESFWTDIQLEDGKCPSCNRAVERLEEDSYFFRLSKYQDKLLKLYEENPSFLSPDSRRQEIINRVKEGLRDISISRTRVKWGIPLPIDAKLTLYVWMDALPFYISVLDYPGQKFKKFWPPDIHLIGKEIFWFHAVIWPAILLSAGLPLPKKVFAHGWLTVNGQKMSKSLGNAVDPVYLSKKYSVDALRYFLLREISFGEDGDFSERALETRFNNELADVYGNFVYRVLSFVHSKYDATIPAPEDYAQEDKEFGERLDAFADEVAREFEEVRLKNALEKIMEFAGECNKYFNNREPWKLVKENEDEAKTVLFQSARAVLALTLALSPFVPSTSEKVFAQLGVKPTRWGDYSVLKPGARINAPEIPLKKIEG